MFNLVINNVPVELHTKLTQIAARQRVSVEQQVLILLTQSLNTQMESAPQSVSKPVTLDLLKRTAEGIDVAMRNQKMPGVPEFQPFRLDSPLKSEWVVQVLRQERDARPFVPPQPLRTRGGDSPRAAADSPRVRGVGGVQM